MKCFLFRLLRDNPVIKEVMILEMNEGNQAQHFNSIQKLSQF